MHVRRGAKHSLKLVTGEYRKTESYYLNINFNKKNMLQQKKKLCYIFNSLLKITLHERAYDTSCADRDFFCKAFITCVLCIIAIKTIYPGKNKVLFFGYRYHFNFNNEASMVNKPFFILPFPPNMDTHIYILQQLKLATSVLFTGFR